MNQHIGSVVQVIGPVLDIRFEDGQLPNLLNAIELELNGKVQAQWEYFKTEQHKRRRCFVKGIK